MGNDAEFAAVTDELRNRRLLPPIDSVFDITQGREAFARLQSGARFGKIVIRVQSDSASHGFTIGTS